MEDIFLVQTDTTVGICSKDYQELNKIKQREPTQKCLVTLVSFKALKQETRVPKSFKNRVRRSQKTTFIYPSNAFRVVNEDSTYNQLLQRVGKLYSTSANLTGSSFQEDWARENSTILIENSAGFKEDTPSKIYKLSRKKLKRVR